MKIGEILVSQGIISEEDVERALKAQKRRGGKLGTNLVALSCISDQALACGLGAQFDLPCANWKDFEAIDPETIELIPAEFVEIHSLVPLRKDKEIVVAIGAPLQEGIAERISALANVPVKVVIAPEIWISAALERYYNLSRHWQTMSDSAEEAAEGHDVLWSVPEAIELPAPNDLGQPETPSTFLIDQLLKASSPKEVMDFSLEFIWRSFPRQAMFLANGMQIEGWLVRGLPTHVLLFGEASLPKKDAEIFSAVIDDCSEFHGTIEPEAPEKSLFELLHLGQDEHLHIFPIRSFNRTIGAFVGVTHPHEEIEEAKLKEVRWALEKAGLALARVALGREIERVA